MTSVTGSGPAPDRGDDGADDREDGPRDGTDGVANDAGTDDTADRDPDREERTDSPRRDGTRRGDPPRGPASEAPSTDGERVLLDAMLGKLATYLRMCGHDAAYALDRGVEADDDLLSLARAEDRRLVTRDVQLAGRADNGLLIESREVLDQLRELSAAGVDVSLSARPARCGACNGPVERVSPADGSVPEWVPDPEAVDVWRCVDCSQYFWKGSHWADVRERLAEL